MTGQNPSHLGKHRPSELAIPLLGRYLTDPLNKYADHNRNSRQLSKGIK